MATETVTFPVSVTTQLWGELSFNSETTLAHFAEVTSERVSIQLELLLKQFDQEDSKMVEVALQSIADLAQQASGATAILAQLSKEKAHV